MGTRQVRSFAAVALCVCMGLSGCARQLAVTDEPVGGYAPSPALPMSVELVLTEAYRTATWEQDIAGGGFILEWGPALAGNAVQMSRELFAEVVVTNADAPVARSRVDAILEPRMVAATRSMGATAFGEQVTAVSIEWQLTDPRGRLVWVETVTGEGRGNTGNVFTYQGNSAEQVKAVLEDLFHESHRAIASSPEIRKLAGG